MSQYVVLEQVGPDAFERTDGSVEARTVTDALRKYLTGKEAPVNSLVAIPVRHFQPVEVEVKPREPQISIKGKKDTGSARKRSARKKS